MKTQIILILILFSNIPIALAATHGVNVMEAPIQNQYSYDGKNVNPGNPEWGKTHIPLVRMAPSDYSDNIKSINEKLPNPRDISNKICSSDNPPKDPKGLSDINWIWGQFISHDIAFTPTQERNIEQYEAERLAIQSPGDEKFFTPNSLIMSIFRSIYDKTTGTDPDNPREQINVITAWMDGGMIYGSNKERADWLRTFENGQMKTSQHENGDLLPLADLETPESKDTRGLEAFIAGDTRSNEHIALMSMHILFLREHNRLAEELHENNPEFTDEDLYQTARAINTAQIQIITYNEYLPSLGIELDEYTGYDPSINPSITNEFSVTAFRMGHSQNGKWLLRLDEKRQEISAGNIEVKDGFFNPTIISQDGGVDPIFRGAAFNIQDKVDTIFDDSVRNFMFGSPNEGGLDLCAIDIIRARDHGIPNYNTVREALGLGKVTDWSDITSDPELQSKLKTTYKNVDNIDLIIGTLAEDHFKDSSVGITMHYIIKDQFERIRNGDPNFYLNDPLLISYDDIALSQIIKRNTQIEKIQYKIFIAEPDCCAGEIKLNEIKISSITLFIILEILIVSLLIFCIIYLPKKK